MEVRKVFSTSRGLFWSAEEANKKMNRAIVYGSHPGEETREEVKEEFVLVTGKSNEIFQLKQVSVK